MTKVMFVGDILTRYDLSRDLTIAKATGKMTADDFREWTRAYYAGTVTQYIVWDLIEADLSDILIIDVLENVNYTKQMGEDCRKGGKTAIVADENWMAICLSKYREVFMEMSDFSVEMRIFSRMGEALEWLGV